VKGDGSFLICLPADGSDLRRLLLDLGGEHYLFHSILGPLKRASIKIAMKENRDSRRLDFGVVSSQIPQERLITIKPVRLAPNLE
jgi:hypothetical protein